MIVACALIDGDDILVGDQAARLLVQCQASMPGLAEAGVGREHAKGQHVGIGPMYHPSSMVSPYESQLFHPMGGVGATSRAHVVPALHRQATASIGIDPQFQITEPVRT
jgi:hypothetical protein